jgi:hypothetical protein
MVLDDVSCGADAVVIASSRTDTNVLSHGDLHMIDVVCVPDGLIHRVGEAQSQDVLNGLFTQIVVDAEHRLWWKHSFDRRIELCCGFFVLTERFLDDDSAPTRVDGVGETSRGKTLGDDRELARRDGKVERVVARRTSTLVELCEHLGQSREPLRVIKCSFHKPQTVAKRGENFFVEFLARVRGDRFEDEGAKLLVVPVASAIRPPGHTRRG